MQTRLDIPTQDYQIRMEGSGNCKQAERTRLPLNTPGNYCYQLM